MIVVADLIGTLTTGSPVLGLADWVRNHQSRLRANLYLASIMPSYGLARLGIIDWQGWTRQLMVSSLRLIHDATPALVAQMADWSVEHELWPKRRHAVLARLLAHQSGGADIVVASSVFAPTVAAFAARIGATAVGTPVEFEQGRVRLAPQLVASEQKIAAVFDRLGGMRIDVAYGDTRADIPLLEQAARSVAVFPDAALRATAEARGWEILDAAAPADQAK